MDFIVIYMRTSRTQSVAALPIPVWALLIPIIADLVTRRAHTTRGELLRSATKEALLFPTLVLGPQPPGASSSSVKAKVNSILDLLRRDDIDELARHAKAMIGLRSIACRGNIARASRRVARLIHKNRLARAAIFAGSLGVADTTLETLMSLRHLFPELKGVKETGLRDYSGTVAPPPYPH
jgi:hypothetical protein